MHPNIAAILHEELERFVGPVAPNLVSPLLECLDLALNRTTAPDAVLQATVSAASSSRLAVCQCAALILGELAVYDRRAMEAVVEMARAKDATIRINAIICLTLEQPRNVVLPVLTRALKDRSARVRIKAGDMILRLKLVEASSLLADAAESEANGKARLELEGALRLLTESCGHPPPPTAA